MQRVIWRKRFCGLTNTERVSAASSAGRKWLEERRAQQRPGVAFGRSVSGSKKFAPGKRTAGNSLREEKSPNSSEQETSPKVTSRGKKNGRVGGGNVTESGGGCRGSTSVRVAERSDRGLLRDDLPANDAESPKLQGPESEVLQGAERVVDKLRQSFRESFRDDPRRAVSETVWGAAQYSGDCPYGGPEELVGTCGPAAARPLGGAIPNGPAGGATDAHGPRYTGAMLHVHFRFRIALIVICAPTRTVCSHCDSSSLSLSM